MYYKAVVEIKAIEFVSVYTVIDSLGNYVMYRKIEDYKNKS
jgi:hypothetical protein